MRPPILRLHADELIVDSFAGGGGASLGIEMALGRSPDMAVNHDAEAIAIHAANHPNTRHYCESVWDVDPVTVCGGRPVGLAWFSPDCTFHSRARGGKPFRDRDRARRRRGLAWLVVRWAKAVRPRVICLENVSEFQDWCPLGADGRPDFTRRGQTFRGWRARLENLGYRVEMRELQACDYGAPTTRKRLFVIARCDGQPIVWPTPTHGPGRPLPYRTAGECIDWSLACPSIFLTRDQARAAGLDVQRPLAEKTLERIARGIKRYVLDAADPFIIPLTHHGDSRSYSVHEPMRTITGAHRGELALVTAFIARHFGGMVGREITQPLPTITGTDHHSLVVGHMLKLRGGLDDHHATAQDWRAPAPTITASGTHLAEVRAFLIKYYGTEQDPQLSLPLHTVTTRDRFGLVTVHGQDYAIADVGLRMLAPRELFRAQGFPDTYRIDALVNGKPLSKTAQVRMVGNSVAPPIAAAIVAANVVMQREIA